MFTTAIAVAAFLLGSFPTGVIVARRAGIDLRTVGSGNVGATNVGRALGRRYAVLVMLVDAGKGALSVVGARMLMPEQEWPVAIAGIASVVGHIFSIFLRGRGGKGVATALGAALGIAPLPALGAFLFYLAIYLPLRLSSVGSMMGALAFPVLLILLGLGHPANLTFAIASTVLIIVRHRENIRRLRHGNELKG
ncbi:MAG: glycerol-3-phosphate 1-O-acyltransferase PlsY [Deltaproteobacteria bacterium]|nr:glycerol-3-phosphate 1-O-acyltransferase PlsY [Deltaproteobacteria bacterium]